MTGKNRFFENDQATEELQNASDGSNDSLYTILFDSIVFGGVLLLTGSAMLWTTSYFDG